MNQIINFYLDTNKLKSNYEKYCKIGQLYYPLKTNSNEEIIKQLKKLYSNSDNGFLITHISHYYKLLKLGITPEKMCLVNVISDAAVIKFLYENGVRYFTFDNIQSLQSFLDYANPFEVKIAVRLNIIEVFDVFSHLGATTTECKDMFSLLLEKNVKNIGISFYLQKETLPKENILNQMLDYIKDNFSAYKMSFINIGGALKPENIDIEKLEEVKTALNATKTIIEPGRYLVGNAGYMESKIIKKKFANTFIIQTGIYAGLLDCLLYHKKFELYLKNGSELVELKYEPFEGSKEFILCGASSDSGDRLGKFYIDSKFYDNIMEDSIIVVDNALAYVEEFFMPLGGEFEKKYNII